MLLTNRVPAEIGLLVERQDEGNVLGDRERRRAKSVELRVETLNIGKMTCKDQELVGMTQRTKVDFF